MKEIEANLGCPSCGQLLVPEVLVCHSCGLKAQGDFRWNEFATLDSESLHFLRIFIQAEGRIREMESGLGLSYPTIRTRISALKKRLGLAGGVERTQEEARIARILGDLRAGRIDFESAILEIKNQKDQPQE